LKVLSFPLKEMSASADYLHLLYWWKRQMAELTGSKAKTDKQKDAYENIRLWFYTL